VSARSSEGGSITFFFNLLSLFLITPPRPPRRPKTVETKSYKRVVPRKGARSQRTMPDVAEHIVWSCSCDPPCSDQLWRNRAARVQPVPLTALTCGLKWLEHSHHTDFSTTHHRALATPLILLTCFAASMRIHWLALAAILAAAATVHATEAEFASLDDMQACTSPPSKTFPTQAQRKAPTLHRVPHNRSHQRKHRR
jgi:hypothetical protein